MASVSFRNVSKTFGDFTAVKNLNLEVEDGEFLVLLGPSGCGKTTTMRMVAGLELVTQGEVYIGDTLMNKMLPKYRNIAMVFQSYALYPHMSVYKNVEYPLKIRKIPENERKEKVREVLEKVELQEFQHRLPQQLSGGQRQRVALGRALVREPTVFLLDEPLSNLDAKLRVQMRSELKHLQHELGITTIYVTHDQIEAMTLAHRVAVMDAGELKQLGTPEEIYDDPQNLFVANFIGSPAMNLIYGAMQKNVFVAEGVKIENLPPLGNRPAVLGCRPEDIKVVSDSANYHIDLSIFSVELTGESILVTVKSGEAYIIAKADRGFSGKIGEQVKLKINPARLYFFDPETENRISLS